MAHAWGMGGLEPPAEGFGGVGGAEPLKCVSEERFPCSPRHGSLRGGVVGVGGGAGENFLEGVEAMAPLSPACYPSPPHLVAGSLQGGGGPPGELGGG